MTRRQFLNDLYRRLGAMSTEEAEQHLTYYAEMLADRMEEGMTEEEAVASMESVDTIAQRILQDAGVPERSVFDDPVEPAEPVEEFAEEKPKKKRRWRIGALIAAVVLLALLPALALGGLLVFNMVDTADGFRVSTSEASVSMDSGGLYVETEDKGVRIGPGGIEVWEQVVGAPADRITWEVDPSDVRELQVEWGAGSVLVEHWDGDVIRLEESFEGALDSGEKDRFAYAVADGELSVTFNRRKVRNTAVDKALVVMLPRDLLLHEVDIETTSADITVAVAVRELKAETVSGDVQVLGAADGVEVDTVSGGTYVKCGSQLRQLEAETVSGYVTLVLEKDAPFTLDFETTSGELINVSDIRMDRKGDVYSRGTGGPSMEVDTTSGDLDLMETGE